MYIGTWKGSITDEVYHYTTPFTLVISGKNDFEYNMNFIGFFGRRDEKKRPLIDTIKTTAFMSNVADRKFLNVTNTDRRVYIAECIYENYEITLLPMAEEFTSFMIRKDQDLRAVLEYHFKTRLRPAYDESFCMRNMKREIPIP